MANYRVLRAHQGDRDYAEGETREAEPGDVAHLVGRVLELLDDTAEPAPANKAEDAAPANKASGRKATPKG